MQIKHQGNNVFRNEHLILTRKTYKKHLYNFETTKS